MGNPIRNGQKSTIVWTIVLLTAAEHTYLWVRFQLSYQGPPVPVGVVHSVVSVLLHVQQDPAVRARSGDGGTEDYPCVGRVGQHLAEVSCSSVTDGGTERGEGREGLRIIPVWVG